MSYDKEFNYENNLEKIYFIYFIVQVQLQHSHIYMKIMSENNIRAMHWL